MSRSEAFVAAEPYLDLREERRFSDYWIMAYHLVFEGSEIDRQC
jgi:hypothetical protein